MRNLVSEYKAKKKLIKNRLGEFKKMQDAKNKDLFAELCFCLLTPQSKAVNCDRAVRELKKSGILFKGSRKSLKTKLKGVRFPNNKALYLLSARKTLKKNKKIYLKQILKNLDNPFHMRKWLIENIKGLGLKEASHFLRNIGLGKDLAILDVHVLRNLKRFGVIKNVPKAITKNNYTDIENRMRCFSEKINIPMEELDLLFWSKETGFVFK